MSGESPATIEKSRPGFWTKLAYSAGAIGDAIKTFSFTTFLLFYYTTVLGLPGTWLALAMSVGLVWDAAVDPLIGYLSDRATTRFGRRHGFMLAGAVGSALSFIAVFNPPSGLPTTALFSWLMVSSLVLRSSNSLFMVPYYALGAELATDHHERTTISGYRTAAALAGTLLTTAAAFQVFLPAGGATGPDLRFGAENYAAMGLAFGIAMALAGLTATFGTWRNRPAAAVRRDNATAGGTILGALRNRSFAIVLASSSLCVMGAAINAALAMHFLTYHARVGASQSVGLYFGAFYFGALAGVVVWVRLTRRLSRERVFAATTMVTAFVVSGGYWLVGEGRPFGTGHISILLLVQGLIGLFASGPLVLVPSLLADITAADERKSGRRRDGVFFGVYSLGQQLSAGIAVLVAGVLVDRFARLVPAQVEQSALTAERLAMVSNLFPALLLLSAGLVALGYPSPQPADLPDVQPDVPPNSRVDFV